jgi:hypothetical protein
VHRRRFVTVALAATATAAFTAAATSVASNHARTQDALTEAREIAVATTPDFRAAVVARKRQASSGAPTAEITVTTTRRVRGQWHKIATHHVPGSYFWNPVTGPRAVCRLEIRTAGTAPTFRPYIIIQLLLSPALGCGSSHRYTLTRAQ